MVRGKMASHKTKMLSPLLKGSLKIAQGRNKTSLFSPGAWPVEEPS
jgi:hypothetical protein